MKYTVRFCSSEAGWKTIATYDNYKDALAEFKTILETDKVDSWIVNTTQVIDENEKVLVEMNPSLTKPKYTQGGIRTGAGRKPVSNPKKNVTFRLSEEEKRLVTELLARIRKEKQ